MIPKILLLVEEMQVTMETAAFSPAGKPTPIVPTPVSVQFDNVTATVPKVPSADIDIASVLAAPVLKKVGYVKASHSRSLGLPQRPPKP